MFNFNFGDVVKSRITDFLGTITERAEDSRGNRKYWVVPKIGTDGNQRNGAWVFEEELETVSTGISIGFTNSGFVGYANSEFEAGK